MAEDQIIVFPDDAYLLNSSGDHVPASSIARKVTGILIGPHWLPVAFEHAIASIHEPYQELQKLGRDIALVYVATERDAALIATLEKCSQARQVDRRRDEDCFADVCRKLPAGWLAVPFENAALRDRLLNQCKDGIFSLAFVGADRHLRTKDGLRLLERWGAEAYPFDDDRIVALHSAAQERVKKQNLNEILVHDNRDHLIRKDGAQIKVADLEGKLVGLYFAANWCPPCQKFTPVLASVYQKFKEMNKDFEVVFISSDEDESSFDHFLKRMPWLAVPYHDVKTKKLLTHWFEVEGIPTLVILDQNGKTLHSEEGKELVYKYGVDAYPFTDARIEELKQEEKAKRASQTLESLLVTEKRDFLLSKQGEVKVSDLKGKSVGLYFSGKWCPPCERFTKKLESVYDTLRNRGESFEVIYLSSDRDEASFKVYCQEMPWFALPFNDSAISSLAQYFDVKAIPHLVIIGPDGKTVTTDGHKLVTSYEAGAFPFTEEHIRKLSFMKSGGHQETIKVSKHEHTLKLMESAYEGGLYSCGNCGGQGSGWVYHCEKCTYDLHPHCCGDSLENDS